MHEMLRPVARHERRAGRTSRTQAVAVDNANQRPSTPPPPPTIMAANRVGRPPSLAELRRPVALDVATADRLANLASIDDDGRDVFLVDLGAALARCRVVAHEFRNRHREARSDLQVLLKATKTLRGLLDEYNTASSLLAELHVDTHHRDHGRWLEQIENACVKQLETATAGGAPTKWARSYAIIELARLHGVHMALLAERDPDSFEIDEKQGRGAAFASELRRTRVDFVRAALQVIDVEATRRQIRDAMALGEREGSLDTPESIFEQKEGLLAAYEGRVAAEAKRAQRAQQAKR
jgi:hypothetical protein